MWKTLKLEFFRERIAQDPSITIDLKIMNDLVNIFGIKKFYQMELDSDWAKRIRRNEQKFFFLFNAILQRDL